MKPIERDPILGQLEIDRFHTYYEKNPITGCWHWIGHCLKGGYGQFRAGSRFMAHRISYLIHIGPIAEEMTIDHLCWNPKCVNPAHLEVVSIAENIRRGTSASARNGRKDLCSRGHPFDRIKWNNKRAPERQCSVCSGLKPTPNFTAEWTALMESGVRGDRYSPARRKAA
jgi:hypothetical protein